MSNPYVTSVRTLVLIAALLLVMALTASVASGGEACGTMTSSTLPGQTTAVAGMASELPPTAIKLSLRNEGFKSTVPDTFTSGLATITVVNNSSTPRGVIIKTRDVIGSPIVRYTPVLYPGQVNSFNTYLGSGTFTAMDYHGMSRGMQSWSSQYKTGFNITEPLLSGETAVAGVAAEVSQSALKLSLWNNGFQTILPTSLTSGLTTITVVNNSSRPRGVVIKATDIAGASIVRHTPVLRTGQVYRFTTYLGPGPFKAMDYRSMTRGMRSWRSTYMTHFDIAQ